MKTFLRQWNDKFGIAPASVAILLVAFVYAIVSWDMRDVDFGEFLRMPIIEMELIQLALVIAAVNILTNAWIRKRNNDQKAGE